MSCRKREIQILRWHQGELDHEAEADLLNHLEICAHCRTLADKFLEIDRFLLESPAPAVPPFLNERIVSRVIDEMRQDSLKSAFRHFVAFFAYFRPALVAIILVAGIGLGVLTGLNLFHSMNTNSMGSPYDVLVSSGIEEGRTDSSFDFIWADTNGGRR